uniref:Secreted protein n=1 Tax=Vespula pensylvanica TaxID=30213 RepID=A0A834MYF7_VESPE|nr:hypothetical protein H0235_018310 [Vespula pensylvanica]
MHFHGGLLLTIFLIVLSCPLTLRARRVAPLMEDDWARRPHRAAVRDSSVLKLLTCVTEATLIDFWWPSTGRIFNLRVQLPEQSRSRPDRTRPQWDDTPQGSIKRPSTTCCNYQTLYLQTRALITVITPIGIKIN